MSVLADLAGRASVLVDTTGLESDSGQTAIGIISDCVVVQPAGKLLDLRVLFMHNGKTHEHTCEMDHMWEKNHVATKEFAIRALELSELDHWSDTDTETDE